MKKFELDYDTVDRITLINLKESLKFLKKELKQYKKGEYLHDDDVVKNTKLIAALELLIHYYGG